ncbi:MAG: hypothetical protein SFV51_30125 [Bryobacteraceae bacterium]|nr:hypothetical protein [Bryobacteraceae bacterium]
MHTIFYETAERYSLTDVGIVVPVLLRSTRRNEVRLEAKVDTGAAHCIFRRIYAESLQLNVESGYRQRFSTVSGDFVAFGHEVTLVVMGIELSSVCYFFEDESIGRDVLGRNGWLNKIRLGVDDTGPTGLLYAARPVD